MKNLLIASILAISVTIVSCDNKPSEDYNRATGEQPAIGAPVTSDDPSANPFAPSPATTDPTQTQVNSQPVQTASVEHYTCPAGHVGGGGDAAGKCSVCGAELAHNAAYHNQPAQTQPQTITPDPANNTTQPQITPTTEPAQNAAGVYHYVCSAGHPGGSGTMDNCAVCGAQLVHNDKYHQ